MSAAFLEAILRLSTAVGSASTLPDIFDAALDGLESAFDGRRASILLFDPDGVIRFKAWRHLSDEYRAAVEGHSPWRAGESAPEPIVVSRVGEDESLRAFWPLLEREQVVSLTFVPLVAGGRVIGKFMLYADAPATPGRDEISAATTIGFLIGFAVERTRATLDAQRERQRLMFALDAASMGTWEWDIPTQTVRWSDNLERLHGLPPGTFTGAFESYAREIHPDDRVRVTASLQRALDEVGVHDAEYRIVAPDGTIRWVQGKGRVETDANGRAVRMTGVCMDITSRKRVESDNARLFDDAQHLLAHEAALRRRLALLADGAHRLLTSLAPGSVLSEVLGVASQVVSADGYAVWRRRGRLWHIEASRGLGDAFTSATLDGSDGFRFDRPIVAPDLGKFQVLSGRMRAYAEEGIRSLVSVPLILGGDPAGSIVFYYRQRHQPSEGDLRVAVALGHLAATAITNAELYAEQQRLRARAEAAQRRAAFLAEASASLSSLDYEESLRSIARLAVPRLGDWCAVDLLDDRGGLARLALTHTDPDKISFAEAAHRRYPVDLDEPRGVARVLRTGEPELYSDIPDALLVETARDAEHLRILREIGLRSAIIVPLSAGSRVFGTITFVISAEERRYDQADLDLALELGRRAAFAIENARLFREAQAANRVKDEFVATLSHELRTPLNVILGRSRMLRTAPELNAARELGDIIERNSAMLARLVEDLLDMSRMTLGQVTIERQPVQIHLIVDSALQAIQSAAAAKQLAVRVSSRADVPPCPGDPTRLQQVVWNLLINAVKFTPAGGTIDVTVTADDDHLTLAVADSGEGITADALPHVFEMFWQAETTSSRRHSGLGIGLSIVRRLVELHGGHVYAESGGAGRGATFTVVLPRGAGVSPAESSNPASAAQRAVT